jgi:hypothetical protein
MIRTASGESPNPLPGPEARTIDFMVLLPYALPRMLCRPHDLAAEAAEMWIFLIIVAHWFALPVVFRCGIGAAFSLEPRTDRVPYQIMFVGILIGTWILLGAVFFHLLYSVGAPSQALTLSGVAQSLKWERAFDGLLLITAVVLALPIQIGKWLLKLIGRRLAGLRSSYDLRLTCWPIARCAGPGLCLGGVRASNHHNR